MNHHHDHHISRRKFIGQASCATVGYTTLLSTLVNLKSMNAMAIDNSMAMVGGEYKALVCLMLQGGSDSYNMLLPTNQTAYNSYAEARSNLAIPQSDILALNGVEYGVHPSMSGIRDLYNDGTLGFISNIGTLIEPITKNTVWEPDTKLPLGLFSHSDQTRQWQTALPHERSSVGWGGKIADLINDQNDNDQIGMNISMNGGNVYQRGRNSTPFTMDPYEGVVDIEGYNDNWEFNTLRKAGIDNMLDAQYQDVFKKTYVDVIRVAKDANDQIKTALEGLNPFTTTFSDNDLSQSLHMVAKMIASRSTLGMKRQIFFVDFGGWDHHDQGMDVQEDMLTMVSNAITEFNNVITELNLNDCVTTFSMSEFGRTLTSNGNGTDHGWGGNVMVMGGAVKGGNIYGSYPDLALDSELEVGGGVYIPTTSCDEYFAELALWLGVTPSSLLDLFPNLGNFYSPGSSDLPLGFMTI